MNLSELHFVNNLQLIPAKDRITHLEGHFDKKNGWSKHKYLCKF